MKAVTFRCKSDNATITLYGAREIVEYPKGSKDMKESHWLLLYPCGYRQFISMNIYEKV